MGARPKVRMADIRAGKVVQASARVRAQPLSTSGVGRDAGVEDCIPQFVPKVKTALKDSKGAYVIQQGVEFSPEEGSPRQREREGVCNDEKLAGP